MVVTEVLPGLATLGAGALRIAILKGIRINAPDVAFDPLAADDAALAEHCLPPRPVQAQTPVAFANWYRAMASRPGFPPVSPQAPLFGANVQVITGVRRAGTQESSRNWSGAYVRPRRLDPMALVQGRWTVPTTPRFAGGPGFSSSVWVGLDGHDRASRLLPQIGTGQLAFTFPPTEAYPRGRDRDEQTAWWQVWRPSKPGEHVVWQTPIPVPVSKGHAIYAQVQALRPRLLSFFLKNESTNMAYAAFYDLDREDDPPAVRPFERRTAEWVVERPLTPDRDGPEAQPIGLPLAAYGETAFTSCNAATIAPDGTLHEFQLQRARLMRMNVWDDPRQRGRLASLPARVQGADDRLLMRYVPAGA